MIITKSIANDTANGIVAIRELENELRDSNITIALLEVRTELDNDLLEIEYKATLSAGELTEAEAIVTAHEGKRAIEDPAKFTFVDKDGNAIGVTEEVTGVKRVALDVGLGTLVGPQGPQGDAGPQGPQGPAGGFGSERHYNASEGESSTTSGSYQNKVRVDGNLQGGKVYECWWYCEVYTTDNDMNVRCQLNDTTTLGEIEHTSVDEGDKHYWREFTGEADVTLNAGNNFLEIDYNDDGGGTARIRRARVRIKATE